MVEEKIQIPTSAGTAEGVVYSPGTEDRWPGVIFYTDIVGIRPSQEQMARRLSGAGYVVLMPNIFYRTGALRYSTSRRNSVKSAPPTGLLNYANR
jgi:carboxymethylenebutenolidase